MLTEEQKLNRQQILWSITNKSHNQMTIEGEIKIADMTAPCETQKRTVRPCLKCTYKKYSVVEALSAMGFRVREKGKRNAVQARPVHCSK